MHEWSVPCLDSWLSAYHAQWPDIDDRIHQNCECSTNNAVVNNVVNTNALQTNNTVTTNNINSNLTKNEISKTGEFDTYIISGVAIAAILVGTVAFVKSRKLN